MVAAAQRANVLLLTAFCNRFYTPIAKAKEWIDAGKLGPLHHLRLRFAGVELMAGTWLADPAQGGGILWESGPHYVDLFRYLVGEMKNIYAKGGTLAQAIPGTDTVAFLAESVDGVVGTMEGSWSSPHTEEVRGDLRRTRRHRHRLPDRPQPFQPGPRPRSAGRPTSAARTVSTWKSATSSTAWQAGPRQLSPARTAWRPCASSRRRGSQSRRVCRSLWRKICRKSGSRKLCLHDLKFAVTTTASA